MILTGGCDGQQMLNDVWVFMIEKMTWCLTETVGKAPEAMFKHSSIIVQQEYLLVFGGYESNSKIPT